MSYNTRNYRAHGGSTWVISGNINVISSGLIVIQAGTFQLNDSGTFTVDSGADIDIASGGTIDIESGGTIDFESGGYATRSLTYHTTALSPLIAGGINWASTSTGLNLPLPTPVAGMRVWFYSGAATTGKFNIYAGTASTNIDRVIGTATEAGVFADDNSLMTCTGPPIEFLAVNSSQWIVVSNPGATIATTVVNTTA